METNRWTNVNVYENKMIILLYYYIVKVHLCDIDVLKQNSP